MNKNIWFMAIAGMAVWGAPSITALGGDEKESVPGVWRPLPCSHEGGLLAERIDVWRQGRLWHMLDAEDDYLLSGFESRPGRHPWQGEHVGKWLHAATLAYEQTRDEVLLKALQGTVERLLATQEPNGYLGTYAADTRFTAMPENVSISSIADDIAPKKKKSKGGGRRISGWDTWTLRYNIYGLLVYERFHPDPRVVEACRKMADLLIKVYGEGKHDLTRYGTRQGISATTLLESIMMLYERTREKKYLDFAEHIVMLSEKNPKLRLMGNMLDKGSVVHSGDGKAYQLMANLLGYLLLYKHTGDDRYLETVQNAWQNIMAHHLDVTGGPWGRHMPYNGNRECFALPQDYDPALADVETCSTTTWIQLNLHLLELTGEARYAVEAERAVFNSLMAAQYEEGINWCYYTRANQNRRPFEAAIKCCSSSGPRALEMLAHYLVGKTAGGVVLTCLAPCSVTLPEAFGRAKIKVTENYPVSPRARIRFDQADGQRFDVEFRDPGGARLQSVRVNGEDVAPTKNKRGFYRLNRAWKTGDEIAIEFEYLLKHHVVTPKDDPVWVAFTYGPWALAQTTGEGGNVAEPFVGKEVRSAVASQWLEPQTPLENGAPRFRVKNTDILLGPFYSAGSDVTGPRTYFWVAPPEKRPTRAQPKQHAVRKQSAPGIDISKAVAKFAPGWSVSNCGDAMNPGLQASFRGRSKVLVTHPKDHQTPCTLTRTVDVPTGKKTVLQVVVSHHQRGDWLLALKVNGQQKHDAKPVSEKTCPNGWLPVTFDLSDWAGQTVRLELFNRATGWFCEAGYWDEIKIESKPLPSMPLTGGKGSFKSGKSKRPNVVIFLVDDLGWADLACYGSRFYDTPQIDALAREGVRFTDAYAACHVCSPSRAGILTGKYPARLDLTDWLPGRKEFPFQRLKNARIHQALPLEEITLAEALKRHGYQTGHFGKWHLGEAPAGPLDQGFDVQVPGNWYKGWPKAGYYAPFKFDGLDDKEGDYLTDRLTDEALKFIEENKGKSFFLYLSHFAVHDPIQGRPDLVKKYEDRRVNLPVDEQPFILESNPDSQPSFTRARLDAMIGKEAYATYRVLPNQTVKVKQRQDNPQFAAMVESVDKSLGRVVARLKALGLEHNTIIIFTSDNGGMSAANFGNPGRLVHPTKLDTAYSTSNLPLRGAKGWLYEGGIRVPLIIKWPGKGKAGSVISEPVTGTDYYPTVLDMVGIAKMPGQHKDGSSLAPLFQGEKTIERDAIYWHFPHYSNHGMQSPGGAIRSGKYKLLEYFENGTVQLFDLEADPGEQNDLSGEHPEIANRLLKKLRQWRNEVGAEMMDPNPGFNATAAFGKSRPNILFCISDDQSYAHAGANGDPVVQTPAFDRIAGSGIRFKHAFCNAPTCGPSRSAILTGQSIWRLEEAGNIHSTLPAKFATYTELLEQAGYVIGHTGKGWSPGRLEPGGRSVNPAGPEYNRQKLKSRTLNVSNNDYAANFEEFLARRPGQKPFCFWLGAYEPHRSYKKGSGAAAGKDPNKVIVPPCFPDNETVRNDMLDYYLEIEHFDRMVGRALNSLEKRDLLDNTIVVVTGDHGMPFPRAKASLYDLGTRVPLAISWPAGIQDPGRTVEAFVHLSDLAPTFLDAAGIKPPIMMDAQSLMDIFANKETRARPAAFMAMERHDGCRKGGKGYPCRAIRTRDYLYIHNFEPTRWPSGSPDASVCARAIPYGEIDSSPTKEFMMKNRGQPSIDRLAELSFGLRPADELYDLRKDPGQLHNVADNPEYETILEKLKAQLMKKLEYSGDPRVVGGPVLWDYYPYYGLRKNKAWTVDKGGQDRVK